MAKDKPNKDCENCNKPFYTKYPLYTKGCCTECRIAIHQRELAERVERDEKRSTI